jgi:hypothetical protein
MLSQKIAGSFSVSVNPSGIVIVKGGSNLEMR